MRREKFAVSLFEWNQRVEKITPRKYPIDSAILINGSFMLRSYSNETNSADFTFRSIFAKEGKSMIPRPTSTEYPSFDILQLSDPVFM
jgi:hypothetical protein